MQCSSLVKLREKKILSLEITSTVKNNFNRLFLVLLIHLN
jgi:hypothetical protein